MASVTLYPSANNGGWDTGESDAYSDNGVYASTAPGTNSTESVEYGNFGFDSQIPVGATINSVTIEAQWYLSTTASSATFRLAALVSDALKGTEHTDTSEPTSDKTTSYGVSATWARDDLLDGTFEVRVGAQRGSGATGYTMYLDYVKVTVDYTPAASGYTITADQGSMTLTGQGVTPKAARSIAGAQGSTALTGQAASLLRGRVMSAAQGSLSLTGQAAVLKAARKIGVDFGSLSLSGQAVTLTYTPAGAYILTAGYGAVAVTGQAAGVRRGSRLTAALGAYTLSGQAVAPKAGRRVTAAQGAYAMSGQAAILKAARLLGMGYGAYALTGQAASIRRGSRLTAALGAYALSGQNVLLNYGGGLAHYTLTAVYGALALTGQAVGLQRGRLIAAAYGAYNLNGQAVTPKAQRRVTAAQGAYVLAGQAAVLNKLAVRVPKMVRTQTSSQLVGVGSNHGVVSVATHSKLGVAGGDHG